MTSRIAIVCLDPDRVSDATALARRLDLPLIEPDARPQFDYVLVLTPEQLALEPADGREHGPIYVDFVGGKAGHRLRSGEGRRQPLGRAIGLKPGYDPTVIDGTAGLGRDGFVLATLGCEVQLIERSPIIAALLEDGLRRGRRDAATAAICARLTLACADTRRYLESVPEPARPDVVYLDPMYPHRDKSALVKKEMRAFRQLVGDDADAGDMLSAALQCARRRVVVKRPKGAPSLAGPAPSLGITSPNTRYDVYLVVAAPTN